MNYNYECLFFKCIWNQNCESSDTCRQNKKQKIKQTVKWFFEQYSANKNYQKYLQYVNTNRVAIGSDRKQFFPSDPTKNKNESDPIRQKILNLKRIGFSKIFASASAIGSDFRPKMLPSAPNRRTSDGLPIRRGHPKYKSTTVWNKFKKWIYTTNIKLLFY